MKTSRGRWSLYQKLFTNEKIKPFLLKTMLLNKETLEKDIGSKCFIRPCFRNERMSITSLREDEATYLIDIGGISKNMNNLLEVKQFLEETCIKEKFYILQDLSFIDKTEKTPTELIVTLQKGTDLDWKITSVLENHRVLRPWELYFARRKYQPLSLEIVRTLGPFYPECST